MSLNTDSSSSRKKILQRIRSTNASRSLTVADKNQMPGLADPANVPSSVSTHLAARRHHTQPSWPGLEDNTQRLIEQMEKVQISITRLQTARDVPAAVEEYRRESGISGELIVSPVLYTNEAMEWPDSVTTGIARDVVQPGLEVTSVTPCVCAIAETGSVVTASGADTPATLNFLPDNQVVVLHENQITRYMEEAMTQIRTPVAGDSLSADVQRAVNFITGPSRTADIEQTLELGAHGPKRMHVLLVASDH